MGRVSGFAGAALDELDKGRAYECDQPAMKALGRISSLAVLFAVACGGSTPPPQSKSSASAPTVKVSKTTSNLSSSGPEVVPTRCIKRKGACLPPVKWAKQLCQDVYPDVALYMFRKGTPWERFYMRVGLNAVNGWGPTLSENLVTGEEVIPINYRGNKEGFVVEGSEGTFDVLRWNGSCVTLDLGEVTKDRPGRLRESHIEWRKLSNPIRDALMEDREVAEAVRSRQRECKGATIGKVSAACERLDKELAQVIAQYVRNGGGVPEPEYHP